MHFLDRLSPVIFLREEAGASITEYVLLASLITVFGIIAWLALGKNA